MEPGLCMPFVERDSHLQLATGIFEIVDPNEGRPEHDMVFSRLPGDIERPSDQVAGFAGRTKLVANDSQSTQGTEMTRLIGENPSIGLFGRVQAVSTGNGDCRSDALSFGEGQFIHGRAVVRTACANAGWGIVRLLAAKSARQQVATGMGRERSIVQSVSINLRT